MVKLSISNLSSRIKIFTFFLLIVYAFVSGIYGYYSSIFPVVANLSKFLPKDALYSLPPKDYVTKWEHDIQSLKEKLPLEQVRMGYLADWDIHPDTASPDQYIFYYLAQYSLAPIWIDRGLEHEWIVLYTSDPNPKDWLDSHLKPYTIENAGHRFFLIHQAVVK